MYPPPPFFQLVHYYFKIDTTTGTMSHRGSHSNCLPLLFSTVCTTVILDFDQLLDLKRHSSLSFSYPWTFKFSRFKAKTFLDFIIYNFYFYFRRGWRKRGRTSSQKFRLFRARRW